MEHVEHYDTEAEVNVIYAIGTSPEHIHKIFNDVSEDDFTDGTCKRRFQKYHKAFQSGQYQEFADQHEPQLTMPDKPMKLWSAVKIVQNHAIRRKMEAAISEVATQCRDYSNDVKDVQSSLKDVIMAAMDARAIKAPSQTRDDLQKVIDSMQDSTIAFYTGLPMSDKTAPVKPGDFAMVCARPGVGKSALCTGMIAENFMGKDPKHGIFFCIEMDVSQNYARLSSQMCGVPLAKYINQTHNPASAGEMSSILETFQTIQGAFPERWFVQGSITLEEIKDMVEIHKPKWIIIDYVQILRTKQKFSNPVDRLTYISMELRDLALTKNIAVIGIAQLKRDDTGAVPSMSQIKGSGQFEQDATHIWLLDRPESEPLGKKSGRNYLTEEGNQIQLHIEGTRTNKAALICSKNRNGPPYYTILDFDPTSTRFKEY